MVDILIHTGSWNEKRGIYKKSILLMKKNYTANEKLKLFKNAIIMKHLIKYYYYIQLFHNTTIRAVTLKIH